MSFNRVITVLAAAALLLVPAMAVAERPDHAGKGKANSKAKAYGKYCQGESKKHVKGEKGTPFSQCVRAMHKAVEKGERPKKACKGLSKKHVKGEKGTPYSRCVSAGADLKDDQAAEDESTDEITTEEPALG
jgi:hypothetical protein